MIKVFEKLSGQTGVMKINKNQNGTNRLTGNSNITKTWKKI